MRIIRELEHLTCEDRLRVLELFSWEKKRPQGDLSVTCPYLKKGVQEKLRKNASSQSEVIGQGDYSFKLKESRFRFNIRKTFFTMKLMRH